MTNHTEPISGSRIAQTHMTPPIFYQYYTVMTSQEHHMLKEVSENYIAVKEKEGKGHSLTWASICVTRLYRCDSPSTKGPTSSCRSGNTPSPALQAPSARRRTLSPRTPLAPNTGLAGGSVTGLGRHHFVGASSVAARPRGDTPRPPALASPALHRAPCPLAPRGPLTRRPGWGWLTWFDPLDFMEGL